MRFTKRLAFWLVKAFAACCVFPIANASAQTSAPAPEKLIDELVNTDSAGFGYSASVSGSQFLPRPDSADWSTALLGEGGPTASDTMTALVRQGADAIAPLVDHLDDNRPTKLKPVSGMMWMGWNDEYDYNRRTTEHPPEGLNRDGPDHATHPPNHQITVGDLCFVALGQIVNRSFSATRYQPTGGLIVSSPTASKSLLAVLRENYGHMTREQHKAQLIEDFKKPDSEYRRRGAIMRIAYYYPEELDALVLNQLKVPTFDGSDDFQFVRNDLYRAKSAEKQKQLFNAYVAKHGPAAKDGILLKLFEDLDLQIADEAHNLHPPLKEKFNARDRLILFYGFTPQVKTSDRPYIDTWSDVEMAQFIRAVGATSHPAINNEVYRIFSAIKDETKDEDFLALPCMTVLKGTGHDQEFVEYCKRRLKQKSSVAAQLREMLKLLSPQAHPGGVVTPG